MTHEDAYAMARELMNAHGLDDWRFDWHNKKRSLGTCSYVTQTIYLSRPLTALNTTETMRNTILHEIAHAKAGAAAGHGRAWKLVAMQVGANPVTCSVAVTAAGKYRATCPNCGYVIHKYRKPTSKRRKACSLCCNKYNGGRFTDLYELHFVTQQEETWQR